jgi:Stage II sporulation protein E (SpoIIE)
VLAGSSPPIGVGVRTGLRQTTLPLAPGSAACLHTDGLTDARTEEGILGEDRLAEILTELGPGATAQSLIERVAAEARVLSDDIATCMLAPTSRIDPVGFRTEQLELSASDLDGPVPRRFLDACGIERGERRSVEREAWAVANRFGGAVLLVTFGERRTVEVRPNNVESIEAASQRAIAR